MSGLGVYFQLGGYTSLEGKKNKVVVIAEPYWYAGHFKTQMQLFLSLVLPRGCRVIVLCAEPEEIKGWVVTHFPEYQEALFADYYYLNDGISRRNLKWGLAWQHLSKVVEKAQKDSGWRVDLVFITFLDPFVNNIFRTLGFRLKFDYPWVGMYILPEFFRFKSNILKRTIQRINHQMIRGMAQGQSMGILDEGVYSAMTSVFPEKKLLVFPDATDERLPKETSHTMARIITEAGGRPILGLVGVLKKRKGLLSFLRAIKEIGPEKYYFLVAGHLPYEEYTTEEKKEIGRLLAFHDKSAGHFTFEFIDDPVVFNDYIAVCDVLFLAYEGFYHSSGILTKAAVFEKLVIASRGYCMGERVEKYGMGLTVTEGNVSDIVEAMKILSDQQKREQLLHEAKFQTYREIHNEAQLGQALQELLEI